MTRARCPIVSAFALCVTAASLAAAPVFAFAAPIGRDGAAPADAVISAAAPARAPINQALPPTPPAEPSLRTLDLDDTATGVEADPERFDGKGLEIWWQHYEQRRRGPQ